MDIITTILNGVGVMWIALISIGILPVTVLVVIGFALKYKKAYWLISGYNTMSKEKRKNVDIKGLGEFSANICFAIAAIITVSAILMAFKFMLAAGIVFALLLPVIVYSLIKAQKYDGNTRNADGKMKTGTKVLIGSIIAFLALLTVGSGVLLYHSAKPAEYTLENGVFKISGMYGQKISMNEISALDLKDTIPDIWGRTNGSTIGDMRKGHYKLKDMGSAKLFINVSKPPFIYIKGTSKPIILNYGDSTRTKELYGRLMEEWQRALNK